MNLDAADLDIHRTSLRGHCYRMLASAADAEDAVQETMVRAWRSLDRFEGRSSVRTWLQRIATNVCLDMLADGSKRMRPMEEGPSGSVDSVLHTRPRTHWLEPIPDDLVLPSGADPYELTVLRQSIRLAFVAALQHLPPRQRATLLLSEVLGWSATEIAECLETSVPAVNSALQRARATLAERNVSTTQQPLSDDQTALLERYVEAFHAYDVGSLVSLLREDATLSMPPYALWLRGPETIASWLHGPGAPCRGSRLVPVRMSGVPAFAQYRRAGDDGSFAAWGVIILELEGPRIASWNTFLDVATLFPMLGLPLTFDGANEVSPAGR